MSNVAKTKSKARVFTGQNESLPWCCLGSRGLWYVGGGLLALVCWLWSVGFGLLAFGCWFLSVGFCLLVFFCWVSAVGLCLLAFCWLRVSWPLVFWLWAVGFCLLAGFWCLAAVYGLSCLLYAGEPCAAAFVRQERFRVVGSLHDSPDIKCGSDLRLHWVGI